jgi:hypothetical protein
MHRRLHRRQSGRVDEHIHPSDFHRGGSEGGHRTRVRDVGYLLEDLVALSPKSLGRFAEGCSIDIGKQQLGPGAEPPGSSQTHTSDAGYNDNPIAFTHHTLPLVGSRDPP